MFVTLIVSACLIPALSFPHAGHRHGSYHGPHNNGPQYQLPRGSHRRSHYHGQYSEPCDQHHGYYPAPVTSFEIGSLPSGHPVHNHPPGHSWNSPGQTWYPPPSGHPWHNHPPGFGWQIPGHSHNGQPWYPPGHPLHNHPPGHKWHRPELWAASSTTTRRTTVMTSTRPTTTTVRATTRISTPVPTTTTATTTPTPPSTTPTTNTPVEITTPTESGKDYLTVPPIDTNEKVIFLQTIPKVPVQAPANNKPNYGPFIGIPVKKPIIVVSHDYDKEEENLVDSNDKPILVMNHDSDTPQDQLEVAIDIASGGDKHKSYQAKRDDEDIEAGKSSPSEVMDKELDKPEELEEVGTEMPKEELEANVMDEIDGEFDANQNLPPRKSSVSKTTIDEDLATQINTGRFNTSLGVPANETRTPEELQAIEDEINSYIKKGLVGYFKNQLSDQSTVATNSTSQIDQTLVGNPNKTDEDLAQQINTGKFDVSILIPRSENHSPEELKIVEDEINASIKKGLVNFFKNQLDSGKVEGSKTPVSGQSFEINKPATPVEKDKILLQQINNNNFTLGVLLPNADNYSPEELKKIQAEISASIQKGLVTYFKNQLDLAPDQPQGNPINPQTKPDLVQEINSGRFSVSVIPQGANSTNATLKAIEDELNASIKKGLLDFYKNQLAPGLVEEKKHSSAEKRDVSKSAEDLVERINKGKFFGDVLDVFGNGTMERDLAGHDPEELKKIEEEINSYIQKGLVEFYKNQLSGTDIAAKPVNCDEEGGDPHAIDIRYKNCKKSNERTSREVGPFSMDLRFGKKMH